MPLLSAYQGDVRVWQHQRGTLGAAHPCRKYTTSAFGDDTGTAHTPGSGAHPVTHHGEWTGAGAAGGGHGGGNRCSARVSGLLPHTHYQFRLRAYSGAGGWGQWSGASDSSPTLAHAPPSSPR